MDQPRYVSAQDTHGCGRVIDTLTGAVEMAGLHPVTATSLADLLSRKWAEKIRERVLDAGQRLLHDVANPPQHRG